jgi:hypothetical protein
LVLRRRLWVEAVVGALSMLRHHGSVYVGMMQWQGGCELSEARSSTGGDVQECLGCWGGWYKGGTVAPRECGPFWRDKGGGTMKLHTDACPSFQVAPFACGPFEARSRHLAHTVARCEYADRYFKAMSRRGDARQDWCVSTDGAQGHALGRCVRTMHVADLGAFRQKYATQKQLNESHSVLIVHPIKSKGAERDTKRLGRLVDEWRKIWTYLLRAPHRQKALAESRISFQMNGTWLTRPSLERVHAARPATSLRPALASA